MLFKASLRHVQEQNWLKPESYAPVKRVLSATTLAIAGALLPDLLGKIPPQPPLLGEAVIVRDVQRTCGATRKHALILPIC
jgi:hypothetical protein